MLPLKSLLISLTLLSSFASYTFAIIVIPDINPGGNTIFPSHTDSNILFTDLSEGGEGNRLRGWGEGLHWDYGNTIEITNSLSPGYDNLVMTQIEVSYLNGNNLNSSSVASDYWFKFVGYDSSAQETYSEIHYASSVNSQTFTRYDPYSGSYTYTDYNLNWGDKKKTYTFNDEFNDSDYLQIEISYDTMIVIQDMELSTVNLVPEPSSYALLLGSLALGLVALRRR